MINIKFLYYFYLSIAYAGPAPQMLSLKKELTFVILLLIAGKLELILVPV